MTEKEKMIAGKVYNSQDSELVAALNKSKSLCRQYNNLDFQMLPLVRLLLMNFYKKSITMDIVFLLLRFGVTTDLM